MTELSTSDVVNRTRSCCTETIWRAIKALKFQLCARRWRGRMNPARNAWRYGFVVSYPPGQRAVSCYRSEPWHVRYLGRTRAAAIHVSGLVPRAWLWIKVVRPPS